MKCLGLLISLLCVPFFAYSQGDENFIRDSTWLPGDPEFTSFVSIPEVSECIRTQINSASFGNARASYWKDGGPPTGMKPGNHIEYTKLSFSNFDHTKGEGIYILHGLDILNTTEGQVNWGAWYHIVEKQFDGYEGSPIRYKYTCNPVRYQPTSF